MVTFLGADFPAFPSPSLIFVGNVGTDLILLNRNNSILYMLQLVVFGSNRQVNSICKFDKYLSRMQSYFPLTVISS